MCLECIFSAPASSSFATSTTFSLATFAKYLFLVCPFSKLVFESLSCYLLFETDMLQMHWGDAAPWVDTACLLHSDIATTATLLHNYIGNVVHCYIYTLLHCYTATLLHCYIATLLHCYIATPLHICIATLLGNVAECQITDGLKNQVVVL